MSLAVPPEIVRVIAAISLTWPRLTRKSPLTGRAVRRPTRHPVLAARYADLASDLGLTVPGGGVRRDTALAADAYVAAAAMPGREPMLAVKDAVRGRPKR